MSARNRTGRVYGLVGTRFVVGRVGIGENDPTVQFRSLTSDVVIGGLDTEIISASHAAAIKDHTKNTNLSLTEAEVQAFGGWKADRHWTLLNWIISGPNAGTEAQRVALLTDMGYVAPVETIVIPLELIEAESALIAA